MGWVNFREGRQEVEWVDFVVVIPGCATSGRSVTEIHFYHNRRTFFEYFPSVSVVFAQAAGGGFWGSHTRRV